MITDFGILLSRVAVGASISAHGAQKAWGWFGGPGPDGAAKFLESLRFVPGERFATAASATELAAGGLVMLGLGGPIGPAALISTMIVAQTTVHARHGYFAQQNGIELGTIYSAAALAFASGGYGRFSLDAALGWGKLREPWLVGVTLAGAVAGALAILAARTTADSIVPSGAETAVAAADDLAGAGDHIAAAASDRPVPADLIVAGEANIAPQI